MARIEHKTEDAKGRAKEALGDLTDDQQLKAEGKTDRASSAVKGKLEELEERAEDAVDRVKDKIRKR